MASKFHFQVTASKTEIYNDPEISLITSFIFCCPIVYHVATASFKRGWERETGDHVPSKSSENSTKRKNGGIIVGKNWQSKETGKGERQIQTR